MTENYNYFLQYLEKEDIFIDKNEFLFAYLIIDVF